MNIRLADLRQDIINTVKAALLEDIGDGDITAKLIPADHRSTAEVITREDCILCGKAWFEEVFDQLGGVNSLVWHAREGEQVKANTKLVTLEGNSRSLLTGERTALDFLQLLSGIATKSHNYQQLVEGTTIKILDTRKTLPGLRTAQKYAVNVGGCHNHRIGLFDAFLIKENHIAACGGISQAIETAHKVAPGKTVEVEVESLEELQEALKAKADVVMLDNFDESMLQQLRNFDKGHTKYEVSGNMTESTVKDVTQYPIDHISVGALTKNCRAVDLSMRLVDKN